MSTPSKPAPAAAAPRSAKPREKEGKIDIPLADINHQLLMALMEIIPDRIYFKDRESRFIAVNKAVLEFFRVSTAAELLGKTDADIFLPEHADQARADELKVMQTGEALVGYVEKEIFPDGRVRYATTTKAPLRDHLGEIIGICGITRDVTEEHERAEKLKEYAETLAEKQAQMEGELELARQVQRALLPSRYPVFPPTAAEEESALGFAYRYQPMGKVGGDFFTVLPIGSRQAGVFICDVMGHGVHAALITAMQRTLVDDLLPVASNPGAFLAEANRLLYPFFERMKTPLYVTGLYAVIDVETGRVRFSAASHAAPLVVSKEGKVRLLGAPKRVPSSVPLGFMGESAYAVLEDAVEPGERLFFYTDGLRDLGDEAEIGLNDALFVSLVEKCALECVAQDKAQPGRHFLDCVLEEAKKSAGVDTFLDDVCLVEVLYRGYVHNEADGIGASLSSGPYGL
ncbi:MAG TPA: SpoIIE family protein phosphatase [Candidatus Methylacidiphilales bacterium]